MHTSKMEGGCVCLRKRVHNVHLRRRACTQEGGREGLLHLCKGQCAPKKRACCVWLRGWACCVRLKKEGILCMPKSKGTLPELQFWL